jgi:hypothetical protein
MTHQDAPAPRLIEALEAITQWREMAEEEAATQLAEVDAEEARLREAIAQLERELEGLDTFRSEIRDRVGRLDVEELTRSYQAIVSALEADAELIEERARLVQDRRNKDREKAAILLQDIELAAAIKEFSSFREQEQQLALLPPSYRRAIQDHHDAVRRRLAPVVRLLEGPPEPVDAAPAGVALVASVDPAEGPPEALVLVLPVDAGTYTEWADRDEDICATLAYRMVAAAAQIAHRAGVPDAPLAYRSFEGMLTIQIWFGEAEVQGDLREIAASALDQVRAEASELGTGRLELYTLWLPPEVLQPPEDVLDADSESGLGKHEELPEETGDLGLEDEPAPAPPGLED